VEWIHLAHTSVYRAFVNTAINGGFFKVLAAMLMNIQTFQNDTVSTGCHFGILHYVMCQTT
jgi:hypothetical protein